MLLFWSSLSIWERLDIIGLSMVTIGVFGELIIATASIRFPYNPTNFSAHESAFGFKKRHLEILFDSILVLGLGLELWALPNSLSHSHKDIAELNDRASTNALAALELQREVFRLKNPAIITDDQRKRFIAILTNSNNVSKVHIEVIVGNCDRPTEQFAFQIRKILNEAGYGDVPYKTPPTNIAVPVINIEDVPSPVNLPPFTWTDVALTKIPNFNILPLPLINNGRFAVRNQASEVLSSEIPFTDKEPDVIALFSGDAPPPLSIPPSVMFFYPTENSFYRGTHVAYAQNDDPDFILYGVCQVFKEIGITVGVNTKRGIMTPGHVAFFIPNR